MKQNKTLGFTMIEVLLSLGLIGILSTIALTIFQETISTSDRSNKIIELETNANHVLSIIEQRIRSSGSVLAYENFGGCVVACSSDWVFLKPASPSPDVACTYIGIQHDIGGDPEIWPDNGYVFLQEADQTACDAINPAVDLTGNPFGGLGETEVLSNRNATDPINGVNVSALSFVIDQTAGENPATLEIALDVRQGVLGTTQEPLINQKAQLHVETTTSLR